MPFKPLQGLSQDVMETTRKIAGGMLVNVAERNLCEAELLRAQGEAVSTDAAASTIHAHFDH